MSVIVPFRALRPRKEFVEAVASLPYLEGPYLADVGLSVTGHEDGRICGLLSGIDRASGSIRIRA